MGSVAVGLRLAGHLGLAALLDRIGIRLGLRGLAVHLVSGLAGLLLPVGDDVGSSLQDVGREAASLINVGLRLGFGLLLDLLASAFGVRDGLISLVLGNLDVATYNA